MQHPSRGYSMIELLGVLAVIAVLSGVLFAKIGSSYRAVETQQLASDFASWVQRVQQTSEGDLDYSRFTVAEILSLAPPAWSTDAAAPTTTRIHPLAGRVVIAQVATSGVTNASIRFTVDGLTPRQCVEFALGVESPFQTVTANTTSVKTAVRSPINRASLSTACGLTRNTVVLVLT